LKIFCDNDWFCHLTSIGLCFWITLYFSRTLLNVLELSSFFEKVSCHGFTVTISNEIQIALFPREILKCGSSLGQAEFLADLKIWHDLQKKASFLACFPTIFLWFYNTNYKILKYLLQNTNYCKIVGSHTKREHDDVWYITFICCYILLCAVICCYKLLYSAIFCYIFSYVVIFCYILLCAVLCCYILLCNVISCYIVLYFVIYFYMLL
jgi:hypothetical protein